MSRDLDGLADVVVMTVRNALAPVLERLAVAESKVAVLAGVEPAVTGLRERVVVAETKAASMVLPPPVDLTSLSDRIAALEVKEAATESLSDAIRRTSSAVVDASKDVGALRERVAVLEVKGQMPGPAGEPGAPGKDGIDGKDGHAGMSYEGVYQEGQTYEKGQLVTWGGSGFHCNTQTTAKPGEGSKDWTLMIKRGRDGKDGKDADVKPVVRVG